MKKNTQMPEITQKTKPALEWQTGAYERHAQFKFILPYPFLLLCKLVQTTPEEIIRDFTDNLSCGSWNREGRDLAKEFLVEYFISHGYGREHYSESDLRQIFNEMNAMGLLFPKNGGTKLMDQYGKWRSNHFTYWFNKWQKHSLSK